MAKGPNRVRLEEIDWRTTLPFTNIFGSFRIAIHRPKIVLALALVILLYLWGTLLDTIFGANVYLGEREHYQTMVDYEANPQSKNKPLSMQEWRDGQAKKTRSSVEGLLRGDPLSQWTTPNSLLRLKPPNPANIPMIDMSPSQVVAVINTAFEEAKADDEEVAKLNQDRRFLLDRFSKTQPQGVFSTAVQYKLQCLNELASAAANFHLGIGELLPRDLGQSQAPSSAQQTTTVVGALKKLCVILPGWLCTHHLWFLIIYGVGAFLLWALGGGAIARQAALHATRDERASNGAALGFGFKYWAWFILAPLIPIFFGLLIALLMAFGGFIMNVWVLDMLGGLLFVLALAGGAMIALVLIGLVAGCNLLYPAIAVEGTDAFDAISRAFNYVFGRPWQMIFYNVVALVYGAITYIFLSVVIYLTLIFTHTAVDWGFFRSKDGTDQFDSMMPEPVFGNLLQGIDWYLLDWSGKVAAVLTHVWLWLLVAVLVAFAISFYFSASTWIYLLLRRAADGTEFDDLYVAPTEPELSTPPASKPATTPPLPPPPAPEMSAGTASEPAPAEDAPGATVESDQGERGSEKPSSDT